MGEREGFLARGWELPSLKEIEFHVTMDTLMPDRLLTIVQLFLLPDTEFSELEEGEGTEMGENYLDNSEWTHMVLLALIEVHRCFFEVLFSF